MNEVAHFFSLPARQSLKGSHVCMCRRYPFGWLGTCLCRYGKLLVDALPEPTTELLQRLATGRFVPAAPLSSATRQSTVAAVTPAVTGRRGRADDYIPLFSGGGARSARLLRSFLHHCWLASCSAGGLSGGVGSPAAREAFSRTAGTYCPPAGRPVGPPACLPAISACQLGACLFLPIALLL
jgi:hypothetical protein